MSSIETPFCILLHETPLTRFLPSRLSETCNNTVTPSMPSAFCRADAVSKVMIGSLQLQDQGKQPKVPCSTISYQESWTDSIGYPLFSFRTCDYPTNRWPDQWSGKSRGDIPNHSSPTAVPSKHPKLRPVIGFPSEWPSATSSIQWPLDGTIKMIIYPDIIFDDIIYDDILYDDILYDDRIYDDNPILIQQRLEGIHDNLLGICRLGAPHFWATPLLQNTPSGSFKKQIW